MTPKYVVEATISHGPAIESRLVSEVAYHCNLTMEWAKTATDNAIVDLVRDGKIVMFESGCYRLSDKAKMEPRPKALRERVETGMERLIREALEKKQAETEKIVK